MKVKDLILSDLKRESGGGKFWHTYFTSPGFRYLVTFRIISRINGKKRGFLYFLPLFLLRMRLKRQIIKYGIIIPRNTKIGKGFYIGHWGGIVVNGKTVIGDNVNIFQGVTIGESNRGKRVGAAVIGNEVYIGPGAKIVGKVHIGNRVAIGANAVVTDDVPDNAVVAGVPAKIISMKGSEGYINRKA